MKIVQTTAQESSSHCYHKLPSLQPYSVMMNGHNNNKRTRGKEIAGNYFRLLDDHIPHVVSGESTGFMKINQIAAALFVSHKHLIAVIQQETGHHPCYFYDLKIIDQAKKMLQETDLPVSEIARILTYDPSNFSKFFKKITGQTPGRYKVENRK